MCIPCMDNRQNKTKQHIRINEFINIIQLSNTKYLNPRNSLLLFSIKKETEALSSNSSVDSGALFKLFNKTLQPVIMAFCNQLSELFRFATPEIKREIVQTCVRTLKTIIVPNEKDPEGSNSLNGAPDGIRTHAYRNHNPRS